MAPHSGLNDLDYIVIGIVLLSGLLALMRGFVREILSLIAWVGAYFAASRFYPLAIPTAHHYIKNEKAAEWAAMAGIFLITLIILMIVGALISSLVKGRALTAIDRSLGFVYGLARGILVVSLIYLGVVVILWPDIDAPPAPPVVQSGTQTPEAEDKDRNTPPDLLLEAKTRPALAYCANELKKLIPKDMLDEKIKSTEEHIDGVEKATQQKMLDKLSTPAPTGEGGGSLINPRSNSNQGSAP